MEAFHGNSNEAENREQKTEMNLEFVFFRRSNYARSNQTSNFEVIGEKE